MNRFGSLLLFGFGGLFLLLAAVCGISLFTLASSENSLNVFLLGMGLGAVGLLLLWFGVRVRAKARSAGYTQNPNWQAAGGYTPNLQQAGMLNDMSYSFLYVPPVKNGKSTTPPKLTVETQVEIPQEYEIVREGWFDRFCKQIRIANEIQTGHAAFDAALYIRTDYPEFAQAYLNDVAKRDALLQLFQTGFSTVTLREGKLVAHWDGFSPWKRAPDELIPMVAEKLQTLQENLPPEQAHFVKARGTNQAIQLTFLWILVAGLLLSLGSFIFYSPMRSSAIFFKSLPYTIPGYLVFAWLAALVLRGNSRSHYRWGALVSVGFFAFLFGGIGATNLVNGAFDSSPQVTHVETISSKTSSRSKKSTTYRIHFPSPGHPGETDSKTVSHSEWLNVVEHRTKIELITSSGALGVEIVRSSRIFN